MKSIKPIKFRTRIHDLWLNQWFLLTSGDCQKNHFNTMTVAWGFLGIMWNKPTAVVVVRPTRFTYQFIDKYNTFTLCAFEKKYREDLKLLGTKSGRDGDKIAETNLQVIPSKKVAAPSFAEAELIIECTKLYWHDFKPENFLDASIEEKYPIKDYHRVYYGEVVEILASADYYT